MGDEYFLQSPMQQRFYHVLIIMLNTLGLANSTWWDNKPVHKLLNHFLHGKLVPMVAPICSFTQIVYLYVNYENISFEVFGIILAIYPISVLININIASSKRNIYKSLMKNFMTQIHIRNYCVNRGGYMRKKLLMIERFTRYTACYLSVVFGLNFVIWISIPLFYNIKYKEEIHNRTLQLQTCVYMWMPFDYGYSFKNWVIVHILNVYIVGNAVLIMNTFHCLTYMLIYHLIGHIQILKYNLRTSFEGDISDEETKNRLNAIIKHHAFIIRYLKDLESAFGVNVAANYLHNLLSDSFIIYQVLNGGDLISYAAMVCAYMGELVLMSFAIEEIRKQSENLPEVVYAIPWEAMSVSNQKIVLLILSRMQTLMQLKALGVLKAGVQPMVSILKTTFSYYVLLKTSIESKRIK